MQRAAGPDGRAEGVVDDIAAHQSKDRWSEERKIGRVRGKNQKFEEDLFGRFNHPKPYYTDPYTNKHELVFLY